MHPLPPHVCEVVQNADSEVLRDYLGTLTPLIDSIVAEICRRQCLRSADAEDFAGHVLLKLLEHDYAILRRFEGRSSIRSFLTTVIRHLFLDFRTAQWGRWRPCSAARRAGPVAILLDRLTTRDGLSFDEAYELLRTNYGVRTDRDTLYVMTKGFPIRHSRRTSEAPLEELPAHDGHPEASIARQETVALAGSIKRALKEGLAGLSSDDRTILALRFRDGRPVSEIARMLDRDAKPLYRHLQSLVKSLRPCLESLTREGPLQARILSLADTAISW